MSRPERGTAAYDGWLMRAVLCTPDNPTDADIAEAVRIADLDYGLTLIPPAVMPVVPMESAVWDDDA